MPAKKVTDQPEPETEQDAQTEEKSKARPIVSVEEASAPEKPEDGQQQEPNPEGVVFLFGEIGNIPLEERNLEFVATKPRELITNPKLIAALRDTAKRFPGFKISEQ